MYCATKGVAQGKARGKYCGDTVTVKYAVQRIGVDQAQLEAWTGWVSGQRMHVAGSCPACSHDSPIVIPQQFTAMEAKAGSKVLALSLACTCDQPHPGRPDDATGCGRHWSCTATADANNQITLSILSDPALEAAADELRTAGAAQLADLRSAAEKWIGGVTALFSLFGLAGVTITRSTVTSFATGWQVAIAIVATVSVGLAGLAVFWIYRAAYGWPVTRVIADNDELRDWSAAREAAPRIQAGYMRDGVRAAGGALAALAVTVGLLWFAPQQRTTAPMVQITLTSGSQVCGTLMPGAPGATVIRRASDGTLVEILPRSIAALTVVAACLWGEEVSGGQVVTNSDDRDCRIPGWLMHWVEVRIPGVVQRNDI
jgi:hypothetical protein